MRVQVSLAAPNHCDKMDVQAFCLVKLRVDGLFGKNSGKSVCRRYLNFYFMEKGLQGFDPPMLHQKETNLFYNRFVSFLSSNRLKVEL